MSLLGPQLDAFVSITETNTVHGAASRLHLTQTAVTQRIRSLEEKLKTTLFIRSRRGMLLTPEGEALLRYCQAAQALEGDALAKIKGAGSLSQVQLSISGPTSLMRSRIIPSCADVLSQFPMLLMNFNACDEEARHHALRAGQCDFAILQQQHLAPEMMSQCLSPEKFVLVGSPAWKGRRLRDIVKTERIIDFNPEDQMTFHYLEQFDVLDLAQQGRHYVNRTESLALLVSKGVGYTTLAKEFAQPYIDDQQLIALNGGKMIAHCSYLAWYHRTQMPDYFKAIIQAIQ